MASKAVGVVEGPRTSFLDHIIPLCHLLQIPLYCSDAWVKTCAELFYPKVEFASKQLSDYQVFYTVEPCRLHTLAIQFENLILRGKFKTIVGFHGNPDKFRSSFWIERYAEEDVVLFYGQHLIDYFREKGVWERLKKPVRIGNLRFAFYKKHQAFFDSVIKKHLFAKKERKTIFWAPTWHFEKNADFFDLCKELCKTLPDKYQLLIKFHPFMFRLFPEEISKIMQEKENVRFIGEISLIYPFLNQADIFLGDDSSVAYDFLVFNKPLFFFGKKTREWGITVKDPAHLFYELKKPDQLSEARENAYAYAFGEDVCFETLRSELP